MAAATRRRRAGGDPGPIPDRKDPTRARNNDTRLFEYETNDHSIQPCVDKEGQAGSPRVVQRNRFSTDTHGVGIGDIEDGIE